MTLNNYKQINMKNLWKYDLPNAWRLIYTILEDQVRILNVILEWFPHKNSRKNLGIKNDYNKTTRTHPPPENVKPYPIFVLKNIRYDPSSTAITEGSAVPKPSCEENR